MWGNVATGENIPQTDESNTQITYSASDVLDLSGYHASNIKLSTNNSDVNGPRFTRPATVAGVAGNDAYNCWNPIAISILTDAGDGVQAADDSSISSRMPRVQEPIHARRLYALRRATQRRRHTSRQTDRHRSLRISIQPQILKHGYHICCYIRKRTC